MINKRNIANELLEAIQDIKEGNGKKTRVETDLDSKRMRGDLKFSKSRIFFVKGNEHTHNPRMGTRQTINLRNQPCHF